MSYSVNIQINTGKYSTRFARWISSNHLDPSDADTFRLLGVLTLESVDVMESDRRWYVVIIDGAVRPWFYAGRGHCDIQFWAHCGSYTFVVLCSVAILGSLSLYSFAWQVSSLGLSTGTRMAGSRTNALPAGTSSVSDHFLRGVDGIQERPTLVFS